MTGPNASDRTGESVSDAVDAGGLLSAFDPLVRQVGAVLRRTFPQFRTQLRTLRRWYAHAYVLTTKYRYNLAHSAPIDPYRVIWVDPDRIEYVAPQFTCSRFQRMGTTVGGDWDRTDTRFTETEIYRAVEAHFDDGRPWEETAFFQRALEEIRAGQTKWGSTSRAELEDRFARIDDLYESIHEHGFRTQRELATDGVADPRGYSRSTLRARVRNDEVAVDIGRDGELLFEDGQHRLAIAKYLDAEAIPVLVLVRHEHWVAFRDAMVEYVDQTGTLPAGFRDHPDLRQLL